MATIPGARKRGRMSLPITTGFYEDQYAPIASQECINWWVQQPQTIALSNAQLKGTCGIREVRPVDNANQLTRGMYVIGDNLYFVQGNSLIVRNINGNERTITTTIDGSGRVSIAYNGTQLCFVADTGLGYVYDITDDAFNPITDADYTANLSRQVVYKDGYFVHISRNVRNRFFISELNNGLSYRALDFGTNEIDELGNTALHVNRNQLYLCGRNLIEPFQNIGGPDFPFRRIPGSVIQKGVVGPNAIIDVNNTFVWIGGGLNEQVGIYLFTGANAVKISTLAIDSFISTIGEGVRGDLENSYTTTYAQNGEFFANFHFPTRTFSYLFTASQAAGKPIWTERASTRLEDEIVNGTWRANHIVNFRNELWVGDNNDSRLGVLDDAYYFEYNSPIVRQVSGTFFEALGERIAVGEIELTCLSGVGTYIHNGETRIANVGRQYSDDGGYTFSNIAYRTLGGDGDYNMRQIWRREGQIPRYRVYRFIHGDPVPAAIIKFEADVLVEQD